MQMLLERSEEHGMHDGLGMIPGTVRKFPRVPAMKVPQMGWNTITPSGHPLFADIADGTFVYFVHSYYADTTPEATIASTEYIVLYTPTMRIQHQKRRLRQLSILCRTHPRWHAEMHLAYSSIRKRAGLRDLQFSGTLW